MGKCVLLQGASKAESGRQLEETGGQEQLVTSKSGMLLSGDTYRMCGAPCHDISMGI